MAKLLAAIRLRGIVGVPEDIEVTLKLLRLNKKNHATIVEDTPTYRGMLQKASGYLTYGEIDLETLAMLLRRRGRLRGNKPVTDEYARS